MLTDISTLHHSREGQVTKDESSEQVLHDW